MVEPFFSREHVDAMRPHIQETVDNLLDAIVRAGSEKPVDFVEKFSLPVPSYVSLLRLVESMMATVCLTPSFHFISRLYTGFLGCHSRTLNTLLSATPFGATGALRQPRPPTRISGS